MMSNTLCARAFGLSMMTSASAFASIRVAGSKTLPSTAPNRGIG